MPTFPAKTNYAAGDVLTAAQMVDVGNGLNDLLPDAKGSLTTVSAANTPAQLTVGANGTTLVADSSQTTGLRWGNNLGFTGGKNLLINGSFQIAQRATSVASITGNGYYTADRWNSNFAGAAGTWTQSVQNVAGLGNSLKMLCTTAKTPLDATSRLGIRQEIEGQNLQNVRKGTASAQPLTVSFWVKSNVTGTYTVYIEDRDNSRLVSGTYSISVADTWEKKSITLPADTTGTWDNDNASSMYIYWVLAAGTNFTSGTLQTTWGTYTAANVASASQANLASATNNYWEIAKVQMEIGSVPTEFQLAAGTLAGELAACQRYFNRLVDGTTQAVCTLQCISTTAAIGTRTFPPMRIAPTPTVSSATHFLIRDASNSVNPAGTSFNSFNVGKQAFSIYFTVASGLVAGNASEVYSNNGSATLDLSAEL